jgi:hypothetical protein
MAPHAKIFLRKDAKQKNFQQTAERGHGNWTVIDELVTSC